MVISPVFKYVLTTVFDYCPPFKNTNNNKNTDLTRVWASQTVPKQIAVQNPKLTEVGDNLDSFEKLLSPLETSQPSLTPILLGFPTICWQFDVCKTIERQEL